MWTTKHFFDLIEGAATRKKTILSPKVNVTTHTLSAGTPLQIIDSNSTDTSKKTQSKRKSLPPKHKNDLSKNSANFSSETTKKVKSISTMDRENINPESIVGTPLVISMPWMATKSPLQVEDSEEQEWDENEPSPCW